MGEVEVSFKGGRLHIGDVQLGIDDLVRAGQALNGLVQDVPKGNDLSQKFAREASVTAMKLERAVWNLYGIGEASWAKAVEESKQEIKGYAIWDGEKLIPYGAVTGINVSRFATALQLRSSDNPDGYCPQPGELIYIEG